jgi:hypothetical protein
MDLAAPVADSIAVPELVQSLDKGINKPEDQQVLCCQDTVGNIIY